MDNYMTVRPTDSGRFAVLEVTDGTAVSAIERDYGRLDSAVAKGWTLAQRKQIRLRLDIDPGRPSAAA